MTALRAEAGWRANWRVTLPLFVWLALIVVLFWVVFHYFILTFAVAGSIALLLGPWQAQLTRKLNGRRTLAAALLVLLVTALLLVPVLSYGALIARQALGFFDWLRPQLEPEALERFWQQTLPQQYPLLAAWIKKASGGTAMPTTSTLLPRVAAEANHYLQVVLAGLATAVFDATIFLMMLFFLLRDGDDLRDVFRGISPLTRGQETEAMHHLSRTVKGVLQSMIIVPLAQGAVAYVGFRLLGVPSPTLWSAMVVFASLIPLVGSPLAWVPAALYLFLTVSPTRGILMALYGTFVICMVDNVIKPIILKGAAQIHTMLGFLSILGGLYAFGPKGLIVGPVVLSLVLSAYRIYRYDVLRWRDERPPDEPSERVIEEGRLTA
jgi:predicted PurR-regulated permease PerM